MAGRPFLNVALPATATAAVAWASYMWFKKVYPGQTDQRKRGSQNGAETSHSVRKALTPPPKSSDPSPDSTEDPCPYPPPSKLIDRKMRPASASPQAIRHRSENVAESKTSQEQDFIWSPDEKMNVDQVQPLNDVPISNQLQNDSTDIEELSVANFETPNELLNDESNTEALTDNIWMMEGRTEINKSTMRSTKGSPRKHGKISERLDTLKKKYKEEKRILLAEGERVKERIRQTLDQELPQSDTQPESEFNENTFDKTSASSLVAADKTTGSSLVAADKTSVSSLVAVITTPSEISKEKLDDEWEKNAVTIPMTVRVNHNETPVEGVSDSSKKEVSKSNEIEKDVVKDAMENETPTPGHQPWIEIPPNNPITVFELEKPEPGAQPWRVITPSTEKKEEDNDDNVSDDNSPGRGKRVRRNRIRYVETNGPTNSDQPAWLKQLDAKMCILDTDDSMVINVDKDKIIDKEFQGGDFKKEEEKKAEEGGKSDSSGKTDNVQRKRTPPKNLPGVHLESDGVASFDQPPPTFDSWNLPFSDKKEPQQAPLPNPLQQSTSPPMQSPLSTVEQLGDKPTVVSVEPVLVKSQAVKGVMFAAPLVNSMASTPEMNLQIEDMDYVFGYQYEGLPFVQVPPQSTSTSKSKKHRSTTQNSKVQQASVPQVQQLKPSVPGSGFDSANQSPSEEMLESPCVSNYSDVHSEESSDSGKGGSDIHMPTLKSPPANTSDTVDLLYEFEIPQDLCGLLIGQHGNTIKFIKSKSRANVYLKRHHYNSRFKLCVVSGSQADVDTALRMIRSKFPLSKYPVVTLAQVNAPAPSFHTFPLPDTMQLYLPEGIMCDVVLSSLVSAGHFFVQQPTHPTYPALSQLYSKMLRCYSKAGSPAIPVTVTPSSICAAPVLGGWYRAEVDFVLSKTECGIKYLDYGGYSTVPISTLRQIRGDFLTIPFQASECYLANVKPISEEAGWTMEAHSLFEELAQGQFLQAQVITYAENGIPYVHLYRIQGALQTVFINRELVLRGVALWYEHEY